MKVCHSGIKYSRHLQVNIRMSKSCKTRSCLSLPIEENTLMGSDTTEDFGPKFNLGNNLISVYLETTEEADKL